jgi:hypothetical protein
MRLELLHLADTTRVGPRAWNVVNPCLVNSILACATHAWTFNGRAQRSFVVVPGPDVTCMYGEGYFSCFRIRIIRARVYRELCARPRFQNAIAAIPRCQSEIAHGPTRTLYKVITSCNNLANGYFPANLPSYLTFN